MNYQEAAAVLNETERTLRPYGHALGVMSYDAATAAPRNSAGRRGETMAFFSGIIHEKLTDPRFREALRTILDAGDEADARTRRRAQILMEESDETALVPAEEFRAYRMLLNEADAVWHRAKAENDWPAFAPCLERIVAYHRRNAARKDPAAHPYDVMLDKYEKGVTVAQLDPFFEALRRELTPVIQAVGEKPEPDVSFLRGHFPKHLQQRFSDRLMGLLGISRDDCSIGETEHPFTDSYGKHDVRITTHYHEDDVSLSMYSVIHEGGHALYELGTGDDLEGTCLSDIRSMGIHESQSRFYENYIGRSRAFCSALLPILREIFPEQTAGADAEKLYRAVNLAKPSLIRTQADELTYGMHVMIRYEIEKALMTGDLSVRDVPGEWNAMYKAYLGVDVPDDRRGCLQDSHWSFGGIGYFPGYALGSAYAAQMLDRMEREIDVWTPVGRGDLSPVTAWLRERIHRFGDLLRPDEVLRNALGAAFDPSYYTRYLVGKYSELYGL